MLEPPKRSSRSTKRDSAYPVQASSLSFNDAATTRSGTARELSLEEEIMSLKVRGLYSSGISGGEVHTFTNTPPRPLSMTAMKEDHKRDSVISGFSGKSSNLAIDFIGNRHSTGMTIGSSTLSMDENGSVREMDPRTEHELAGGVEDWENIEASEIDR